MVLPLIFSLVHCVVWSCVLCSVVTSVALQYKYMCMWHGLSTVIGKINKDGGTRAKATFSHHSLAFPLPPLLIFCIAKNCTVALRSIAWEVMLCEKWYFDISVNYCSSALCEYIVICILNMYGSLYIIVWIL